MRFLFFDQDEFDNSASEESLCLAVAWRETLKQFVASPNAVTRSATELEILQAFVDRCVDTEARLEGRDAVRVSVEPFQPVSFHSLVDEPTISDYLQRFARVTVEPQSEWPVYVFRDDWDDKQIVIATTTELIWYHWYTTA